MKEIIKLKEQLIEAGHPLSLILDYLDTLDTAACPSVEGFDEYAKQYDESCNAQIRWYASQRRDPIFPKPNYWHR